MYNIHTRSTRKGEIHKYINFAMGLLQCVWVNSSSNRQTHTHLSIVERRMVLRRHADLRACYVCATTVRWAYNRDHHHSGKWLPSICRCWSHGLGVVLSHRFRRPHHHRRHPDERVERFMLRVLSDIHTQYIADLCVNICLSKQQQQHRGAQCCRNSDLAHSATRVRIARWSTDERLKFHTHTAVANPSIHPYAEICTIYMDICCAICVWPLHSSQVT